MIIQTYRQRCFSSSMMVEGIWDDLAIFGIFWDHYGILLKFIEYI